ncbi:sulfotransferase domain-containing protein [Streptacidiphilus jiangxiensis]|uniref:Sulfotransferase domain-containing protein n=1 Tax=Streptacidiphilus jiangxiensis TaxID=235985 RepID=A0A1H7ZED8_STRJI|nr:sulfotransferase domain-containing protein [Streptacidiphilus jiangxiensis]SEM56611.1 hypothetical protein SAMN05414137_13460 [Streptacidiphilus jiangxiensis]
MQQAPRTMVVSLQKTGTHLMQGLMLELGYKMTGVPRPAPDNTPEFDDEALLQIASITRSREEYAELQTVSSAELRRRTQDDWAALGWSWQRRLGQRVVNRYGQTRLDHADSVITNPHINYSRFADTPPGLCWMYHELDLDKVDGTFLQEWVSTGSPRLIFNYRDPRDTVVSMINFLEGKTAAGYGNFYEFDIFHRVLTSMDTWEEKIDYALRDTSFLGRDQFERSLWMLRHPDVCKVSYEDLVGPNGGGTRERQLDAVSRLLTHIGSDLDPEKVADTVYNQNSWSFFKGRTGTWREYFNERNLARFNEQFGDLLQQFGYE